MDHVNLGATGLRVSRVCLGMMSYGPHETRPRALDQEAAEPIVRRAVEGGITFFDTADVYNGGASEEKTSGSTTSTSTRSTAGIRAPRSRRRWRRCTMS